MKEVVERDLRLLNIKRIKTEDLHENGMVSFKEAKVLMTVESVEDGMRIVNMLIVESWCNLYLDMVNSCESHVDRCRSLS